MPTSPLIKATLAAAVLSSTSNILSQILQAYRDSTPFAFDPAHFLRFVLVTLITTPPNYKWQQWLEANFPAYERSPADGARDLENQIHKEKEDDAPDENATSYKPKLNWRNTLTKWFMDCITVGALVNTVIFFLLMGIFKHQDTATIGHNIRTQTIPLIVAGYKIWPFASIISFSCIPMEKRIIFLNAVGLLWGIYMSLVAARV
jgi:hypothetical protein